MAEAARAPVIEPLAGEGRYAGFWIRVAAALIDWVMLMLICIPVILVFGPHLGMQFAADISTSEGQVANDYMEWMTNLLSFVIQLIYEVALTASTWQATVGKRVLGLYVADARDGGRLTVWRSLLRVLAKFPSALILGVGFLMIAFSKRKQGLHDRLAQTYVLRKQRV